MLSRTRITAVLCAIVLAPALATAAEAQPGASIRMLTGTVTDAGHEPLAGAVVQVHDDMTDSVLSYITDRSGRFTFKRLSASDDYKVFATYKGHRSRARSLSKFDSKLNRTLNLTVKLN